MNTRSSLTMLLIAIAPLVTWSSAPLRADGPDPKALVRGVVDEAGGAHALVKRRDVEYTYIYRRGATGELRGEATWTDEISVGIRFNNGFPGALFEPPPIAR